MGFVTTFIWFRKRILHRCFPHRESSTSTRTISLRVSGWLMLFVKGSAQLSYEREPVYITNRRGWICMTGHLLTTVRGFSERDFSEQMAARARVTRSLRLFHTHFRTLCLRDRPFHGRTSSRWLLILRICT